MRASAEMLEALFEKAPRFVARLAAREFDSWDELLANAERMAPAMAEDEQIELINGHPRIGADPGSVSAMSFREQGYGLDAGPAELQERLDRLNDEYEQRFGFRCVVFVDGRSREVIADWIATRLDANRESERRRALADVIAIARDRLTRAAPGGK